MQIKGLHKNIYKLASYALSQEKLEFHRKKYVSLVESWKKLKSEGVSDKICQDILGISRATYYRYNKRLDELSKGILPPSKRPKNLRKPLWGEAQKQLVLSIRRKNPTYGKEKIAIILNRDHGQTLSESTVGLIFKKHAKPWTFKDYKTMVLGERVQIDHMTVTKNGITFKHFQAWDRNSKYMDAGAYSNATSKSAKKFLLSFVAKAPFPILSIQVDGGSEFMADFEEACAELFIPLIVLPPKKPEYNGGVERGNRIFREEFYNRSDLLEDSVRGIESALRRALLKYNSYRPHRNLKGLTPLQYIQTSFLQAA